MKGHREFKIEKLSPPRGSKPIALELWNTFSFHDLEIGCGVGWHPISYAQLHPERLLIALERTSLKFQRFQGRLEKHPQLKNLVAVHADAIPWVAHYIQESQLDRIFIMYPNPYPKNPAARFFNMPFMKFLISRLKINGQIFLASNDLPTLEEAKFNASNFLPLSLSEELIVTQGRTHFEKKYLERGELCTQLCFTKRGLQ